MKRVNIERILCPIDFSDFSRDALDHAVALARWYDAALTVMNVVEIPLVPADGPGSATLTLAPLPDRDEVANEVREFVRPALGPNEAMPEIVVTIGIPAIAVRTQAEGMRASLVVVGTHGRTGFRRFLLGSVTERLLRVLTVPLLVVPPPVKKPETVVYETILCPVDFSPESMRALDYALSLAQESGARIVLLHVLEGLLEELDPDEFRNVSVAEYLRNAEQDAAERLRAAVPETARVWAHPVERVVRGRAYRRILAAAEEERAGLIVMGVRGRGALNRLLFGSNTEHIVREAKCPVLTLHAEAGAERGEPARAADSSAAAE